MTPIPLDAITVVIVTYNSAHCLPALAEGLQDMKHVVVVDNASDDDLAVQLPLAGRIARL